MCIRVIWKNRSFPGLRGSLCSPRQQESRKREENASRKIKGWLDKGQCGGLGVWQEKTLSGKNKVLIVTPGMAE